MGKTGKERQAELAARKRGAGLGAHRPQGRSGRLHQGPVRWHLNSNRSRSGPPSASQPVTTDRAKARPKPVTMKPVTMRHRKGPSAQIDIEDLLAPVRPPEPADQLEMLTFGSRMREARKAKGWSQPDLAKASGMSRSALGNIETGRFGAGPKVKAKILAALGLPDNREE
jgi:ribosome-binding protein aMBF1 (putative translation factor)